MTHDTLTNAINGILGFRGQRIGFPDGRYYNECTAVVAHLHQRLGIPLSPMYGARADGWGVAFPPELAPFYSHEAFVPGKPYPYGTLLLWNSPHIAIVLSHDGGNIVQVFQQNADPNGAPCEVFNRVVNNQFHQCTYALIPIIQEPVTEPLWRVDNISPKQVKVNPGRRKWNLGLANFNDVEANPITTADNDTHFTAVAVLHHREIPQYNYYLEDANTPHGWNVLDCGDYSPPPPPPLVYVPPAAPVKGPPIDKVTLVTPVMAFPDAMSAKLHKGMAQTLGLKDGIGGTAEYIVISRDKNAYNLSNDNMKDRQQWVNIDDNKLSEPVITIPTLPVDPPPPTPAAWVPKYTPLRSDGQPVIYKSKNAQDYPIVDYSTGHPAIYMPPRHTVRAVDQFTGPDSKTVYYRSEQMAAQNTGYGIPKALLEEKVFDTELSRAERLAMRSANLVDKAYYQWIKNDRRFLDPIKQVVAGITQGRKK